MKVKFLNTNIVSAENGKLPPFVSNINNNKIANQQIELNLISKSFFKVIDSDTRPQKINGIKIKNGKIMIFIAWKYIFLSRYPTIEKILIIFCVDSLTLLKSPVKELLEIIE